MKVLVTGAAGFIGSHTILSLIENGYEVVGIDNFCNSCTTISKIIENITGKKVIIYNVDVRNQILLDKIFKKENPDSIIHFAGLKSVENSIKYPLKYYENNVSGTISLCNVMQKYNVKKLIFSSSAMVYSGNFPPFKENMVKKEIKNPYGKSKSMIEDILFDFNEWEITILRYFNPIGAHESGLIGDSPKDGNVNNLMPYLLKVAKKEYEFLNIFGNDYSTKDGTCIRDYIHITDLSKGHVKALQHKNNKKNEIYNLGTGNGVSVLELINTFEEVNNIKIKYKIANKRLGDIASSYACCEKAQKELFWKAELSLKDMCRDSWNFIKINMNN